MAISREEAIAELQRRGVSMPPDISPPTSQEDLRQEATEELRRRGIGPSGQQLPHPSLLSRIGTGGEALGLGALQGVSEAGEGIAGLGVGALNKLLGTHFRPARGDVFYGQTAPLEKTLPAQIGKDIGETAAGIELGGPLAEMGPLADLAKLSPTAARALGFALGGAATTPGGQPERLKGAAISAAFPVGGRILRGAKETLFPKQFSEKYLSQLLREKKGAQKAVSKSLYDNAFENTENIKPTVSQQTLQRHRDLLGEGKLTAAMKKSFEAYERNPTVEGLHFLKSDLRKEGARLSKNPSLTTTQSNQLFHIEKLNPSLEEDIQNNLVRNNPEAFSKYMDAQRHYATKMAPFSKYKPIRDALSKEESAEGIKRILKRDEKSAESLRGLLGLTKKEIERTPPDRLKLLKKTALSVGLPWIGYHELHKISNYL